MSEAEYIELIQNGLSHAGSDAMNYVYVLFAYLAMSYLVGRSLTSFQAWSVSILYTVFLILPGAGAIRQFSIAAELADSFSTDFPETSPQYFPFSDLTGGFPILIGVILLLAWVLSIVFFTTNRTNRKVSDAS